MERPTIQKNIDWNDVMANAMAYLDEVEEGHTDTDTAHYIFESVMTAVFGEDVFRYVNKFDV